MATLIDKTYFAKGLCAIANSNETDVVSRSIAANVQNYIDIYESEYLKMLLGDDLYDYVMAHPSEPRIVALIGKLKNTTTLQSPIANYVFYRYMKLNQVIQTQSGDKENSQAGMITNVNASLYVAVWNQMVDWSIDLYDWLVENSTTYPEFETDLCAMIYERINILSI